MKNLIIVSFLTSDQKLGSDCGEKLRRAEKMFDGLDRVTRLYLNADIVPCYSLCKAAYDLL